MSLILLRAKKDKKGNDEAPSLAPRLSEAKEENSQKWILCKFCEHTLTTPELAIEPHGQTFRNAYGVSYHIVCYADAVGTTDSGIPTTEYTWFPGYAWSYAHCTKCRNHVGWWFVGESRFIGLIATRLIR